MRNSTQKVLVAREMPVGVRHWEGSAELAAEWLL